MGETPLDLVSVEDIGQVARTVFLNKNCFLNKTLSLCGEKLTIREIAAQLTHYLRPYVFKDKPVSQIRTYILYIVRPVNKGHQRDTQDMVFIDKWSLFRGNFVLFFKLLKCGHYLRYGGLYSKVVFNTGLTVFGNK